MGKDEIIALLLKRIDVKSLVIEDLLGLIFKKIDDLVKDSENKLDDALAAIIKPQIKAYLELELSSKIDSFLKPEKS